MIELSPSSQLLAMGIFAVLFRYASKRPETLPTPAAAAVMAIGIFIAAPLQQMRPFGPSITEALAIALLVVWASMAASYLRSSLHEHSRPVLGRFAIGTWIAATAVVAHVVMMGIPEWRWMAVVLAVAAVLIWFWFLGIAAAALPILARTSMRKLTPGVVLLATVSTQSLALAVLDLMPPGTASLWLAAGLIGAGAVFYLIGMALILLSHAKAKRWTIAEDWDNTNCILHGAMSITGLALATHPMVPPALIWAVWCCGLGVFIIIESIEIVRLVLRVQKHGWRQGAFSYRVTQWSRNFTFGMLYAFTLQLPDFPANIGPTGWMPVVRSFILAYGSYAVLLFLLLQIFIYCGHRFPGGRLLAVNPWSHNRLTRRTASRGHDR